MYQLGNRHSPFLINCLAISLMWPAKTCPLFNKTQEVSLPLGKQQGAPREDWDLEQQVMQKA